MKTQLKNRIIAFGSSLLLMSIFSMSVLGGTLNSNNPVEGKGKKAVTKTAQVKIEVIDQYGIVKLTDKITQTDKHIDFDLKSLPVGNYTVAVKLGENLINQVSMTNVSTNTNVMTVEVLNRKGDQVYEIVGGNMAFDLTKMPKGKYTVNVYKGATLVNTHQLVK